MSSETKKFERQVRDTAKDLESNAGRNLGGIVNDWGRVFQGDFNNLGGTLLRTATVGATGGYSLLANPDDQRKYLGETGGERFVREQGEQKQAAIREEIQAAEDERRQKVINRLAAEIEQRRLTPGTSLLTVGSLSAATGGSNTLLTRRM